MPLALDAIKRAQKLKDLKNPWNEHWQLLGEYIHARKQEFTAERQEGDFLNQDLFDSTGPKAAKISASAILSMIWPQAVNRFRFADPELVIDTKQDKQEKSYYEFATRKVTDVLDNPAGGLPTALDEILQDQVVFSTSGLEIMRDKDTKVVYRPWGVKHMSISEGRNGFVDTIAIDVEYTVNRIIAEYGKENVGEKIRKAAEDGRGDSKEKILILIEPRTHIQPGDRGNKAMPWRSLHVAIDSQKLLKEGGFEEIPIKVVRFTKLIGEVYGRGFGMDALPDILESNAIWESVTVAIEKTLDPPLGVLDDGKLGAGEIDTSAGAINVFNITGRAGEKNPVFPLFVVGEIKQTVGLLEKLEESISNHFSIDRLLDFNNEQQMTLGEAQLRNKLRNATLGTIFTRLISELISPMIQRTFNLLFEMGELGVVEGDPDALTGVPTIPPRIAERMILGEDVYKIEYFTPAMRVIQAEEAEGILRTIEFAGMTAGLDPASLDNIDLDVAIRRFRKIAGAPSEMEKAEADVVEIRAERDRQLQKQQELQAAQQASEAARNVGQSGLVPTNAPQQSAPAA